MAETAINLAAASLTFSVLSFLLLIVGLFFFLFPDFSATIQSGLSIGGTSSSSLRMVAAFLGAFSPDITLLSGFVSDIMNGSFRYSVTSLIGIGGVVLHWLIAGLLYGFKAVPGVPGAVAAVATAAAAPAAAVAAVTDALGVGGPPSPLDLGARARSASRGFQPRGVRIRSRSGESTPEGWGGRGGATIPQYIQDSFNPCSIRGLGMFDNTRSPMGMAALTSVFAVYLLDMTVGKKREMKDTGVYLLFSGVVYGLNLFAYKEFGCYGTTIGEIAKSTLLPIIVGAAAGIAGYATLSTTYPAYLPLDTARIGSPSLPGTYARCTPPNDQDQFVCDAYKDGKRISSAVVE